VVVLSWGVEESNSSKYACNSRYSTAAYYEDGWFGCAVQGEVTAVCCASQETLITWRGEKERSYTLRGGSAVKTKNLPKLHLNSQSVPRSKHTPSLLYKPVS
jgi:phage FluMu gp28-like protein